MSTLIDRRRARAKEILEAQLLKGTKPEKINKKTTSKIVPLTPKDKVRIENEIEILSKPRAKK